MARQSILQNRDALQQAIEQTNCIKDCLELLGLRSAGGNYKAFHIACDKFGLDCKLGTGEYQLRRARNKTTIPLAEILVEDSKYTNRFQIKKRCYQECLLYNHCYICNMGPEWCGEPITLQLDHINGVYNDNRLPNLRILCPNCHSQTSTYATKK